MAVGDRNDPYRSFNFLVEIDGIARAGFQECSPVDSSQDPIEYREGTDPLVARKLPGVVKYTNITLKRGITDDASLYEWHQQCVEGKIERRNGSIVLLDDAGEEKLRWNFREAWPTKWTGPTFSASANQVAIETLEIAHEGVVKA